MRIVDILDRPAFEKDESPTLHTSEEFEAGFTDDAACLEIVVEELAALNSDEVSRFDGWTNKGAAMLGASGLILSLVPLGLPLIEVKGVFRAITHYWVWFCQLALFIIAVAEFFLATWNSLVSLRARPLCRLDEDAWQGKKQADHEVFRRELAAQKMATYKNNVDIVNLKATKVNEAWRYFFLGCLTQMLFLALSVVREVYWK